MKRVLILFLGAFTLFSCGVDEVGLEVSDNATPNSAISSQYSISEEEALANLYAFMGEGGDSRSSDNRVVSTVLPVKYGNLGTRAVDGIDCENLLYIANFENEAGYAILAGDTRIDDEVIAITDRGSLDPETLGDIIIEWENNGRTYYEDYPMTGPGFFTVPEAGDEVFMNPNTVNMYDEEVGDWLIGTFDPDRTQVGSRAIYKSEEFNTHDASDFFAVSLSVNYANSRLIGFTPGIHDDGDGDGENTREYITKSSWRNITTTESLLSRYKAWGQWYPFNDRYPWTRKYLFWGEEERAPAGCFPLAIAKLMTYFQTPANMMIGLQPIYWADLHYSHTSLLGSISAAHLLPAISQGCASLYFYEGTFTFPIFARGYMRSVGFYNVHSYPYDLERVKNMIDNDCPLIIYGMPGSNVTKSHAWNIDGYKTQERTITTEVYVNGIRQSVTEEIEYRNMVHCDFGWQGYHNGYYTSGIFDLNGNTENIDLDPNTDTWSNTNYNSYIHIITYDKPV